MLRTATALGALSVSLGLALASPAVSPARAEPLNAPIQLTGPMDAVRHGGEPEDWVPEFAVAREMNAGSAATRALEEAENTPLLLQTSQPLTPDQTSEVLR